MQFSPDRWLGNQWASIEIEPVDETRFLPLLTYLTDTYQIALPPIIDTIDGYAADFTLADCPCTLMVDAWSFSIAFEHETVRDAVLAALNALPGDYFP